MRSSRWICPRRGSSCRTAPPSTSRSTRSPSGCCSPAPTRSATWWRSCRRSGRGRPRTRAVSTRGSRRRSTVPPDPGRRRPRPVGSVTGPRRCPSRAQLAAPAANKGTHAAGRDSEYAPGELYMSSRRSPRGAVRGLGRRSTLKGVASRGSSWTPDRDLTDLPCTYQSPQAYRGGRLERRPRPSAQGVDRRVQPAGHPATGPSRANSTPVAPSACIAGAAEARLANASQERRYSPDARVISPKSTRYRRSAATSGWKSASRWLTSFSG